MLGVWTSVIVVVSGGGSAATRLACRPRSPAVPASVNPSRNLRRLNRLACWVRMGTSLPDASQCDTWNAGQWTLLPSHKWAQHLTPSREGRADQGTSHSTRWLGALAVPATTMARNSHSATSYCSDTGTTVRLYVNGI